MNLIDLKDCGNRLDTSRDLNGKYVGIWGPDVGMGDWANATAAFKALKEKFPGVGIILVCSNKIAPPEYLLACPYVDMAVPVELMDQAFVEVDYGINFQIDDQTLWKPDGTDSTTAWRQFTELGLPAPGWVKPCFNISEFAIMQIMKECMHEYFLTPGFFIIHHCGARNPALRWPHDYVKKFAALVSELNLPVVVVGYRDEWGESECPNIRDLTGTFSVLENMALMKLAGWFVGGHSGFNCIGGGLPIRMISLYPYYRHFHMWSGFYRNSYNLVRREEKVGGNLLLDHTPERVFEIFKKVYFRNTQLPFTEVFD